MQSTEQAQQETGAREAHWQAAWAAEGLHRSSGKGTPYYALEMWPYPSGELHMGHVRCYTLGDVFARYMRLRGRDVLHPMGWDAFGLPAENQAIKEKVAPQVRTPQNVARMRTQMQRLGLSYDWDREEATFSPSYYRWNQWFFLQMVARGLVYRRQSQVNYCPGCQTTLANEQVESDGRCWRGHDGVTQRVIPEWAFRITAYAEQLLAGLDTLTEWPNRVVQQQRNWIGKSEGARLRFALVPEAESQRETTGAGAHDGATQAIEIFTTRAETLYGCTYLVLAAEHPAVAELTTPAQKAQVAAFVAEVAKQDPAVRTAENTPKQGVFTGRYVCHPLTGEKLPVWLGNFVLANYGTGAVMAVPAHDARDFAFARSYGLPLRQAVGPAPGAPDWGDVATWPQARDEAGVLVGAGAMNGLASAEARTQMVARAEAEGFGQAQVQYHLRDWGFSRQRYWGTPIPIVYCDVCGTQPVKESDLPVQLPDYEASALTGQGGAPLAKLASFVHTTCPKCTGPARREVDTMDTFVDSSWYFARFLGGKDATEPFSPAAAARWLPVNLYVGGPEHAVMHLLYFRFFTQVMHEMGLVPVREPVVRLLTQGMVNGVAFRCAQHGYIAPREVVQSAAGARCPRGDCALQTSVEKMSKSKYNGVDPTALVERYGADTARLYTLFAAPAEKDLEWSDSGVEGQHRFVMRLRRLTQALAPRVAQAAACTQMAGLDATSAGLRRLVHRTLQRVQAEYDGRNHFNTAIAAVMELTNAAYERGLHEDGAVDLGVGKELLLRLSQMLSPMAPHVAEDIWQAAGGEGLVAASRWPAIDDEAAALDVIRVAVQVNGKLRGTLKVAPDVARDALLASARAEENVARHMEGKTVVKEVVVPGRLVNFVVRG